MKKVPVLLRNMLLFSVAAVIAGIALLCPGVAHAQGGVPLWTNRLAGSSQAIATDSNGNVFVTGDSTVTLSADGLPLWTNRGGSALAIDNSGNILVAARSWNGTRFDCAITKYSNSGVLLWSNVYRGQGSNGAFPKAVAVDPQGDVLVLGTAENSNFNFDYLTLKYSSGGAALWTNIYNGPGNGTDSPAGIAVDSRGNVFVTGASAGVLLSANYATVAYSTNGSPLWVRRYSAGFSDTATAIAVDTSGNIFVTGYSRHNSNGGSAAEDIVTIAYSNSGAPLWTNRYDGPAAQGDQAWAIAVDGSGNIFVAGASVTIRDFVSDPPDYAVIKYSNAGVPLWTNFYNGPGGDRDRATAIVLDRVGNVIVTGLSSQGYALKNDWATVGYSNAGGLLWENRYPDSEVVGMAVDPEGNVLITGISGEGAETQSAIVKYASSSTRARLVFAVFGSELVLSWTNAGFTLQSAPVINGPFANIPGATSPFTNTISNPQQFFRLMGN